jgi:alkanesulfonate monooxygenase SsuD/methylene tetrahydromethanopterin reductase-like flavin-dependent oxidoreductase (luciferase family)
VQLAQYGYTWTALLSSAREAEAMGVDVLFNWDHFFGPGPDSQASNFECWTVLAAWAASTTTIELGPLVSAIGYRNPDLLADMYSASAPDLRPATSTNTGSLSGLRHSESPNSTKG